MGKVSPMNFVFICFNNIFFVVLFPFQCQSVLIKFNFQKFTEDEYNKIIAFLYVVFGDLSLILYFY